MKYPTIDEIKKADRLTICYWWRFLPLNWGLEASNEDLDQVIALQDTLAERFNELGGFTPEISKHIG